MTTKFLILELKKKIDKGIPQNLKEIASLRNSSKITSSFHFGIAL
jgi:hypothetical protein